MTANRLKKLGFAVVQCGVLLAVLAYIYHVTSQEDTFRRLTEGQKNWPLVILAMGVCFTALLLTFFRWRCLVVGLNIPFPVSDALRLGFLGFFCNFLMPGSVGGDFVKAIFVAKDRKGVRTEAVATIFIDRILGLYGLLLVVSTAILAGGLGEAMENDEIRFSAHATLVCAVVATGTVILLAAPGIVGEKLADQLRRAPLVGDIAYRLIQAIRLYRSNPPMMITALGLSLGVHLLLATSLYLLAKGLPGSAPSLGVHLVMVPLASLVAAIPIFPGGVGGMEVALEYFYMNVPTGLVINKGQGLVVALGYRIITMLIAAIGLFYYLHSRREVDRALHAVEEQVEQA